MRPNKYTMSAKPQYFHYTPEYRIKEIIESGEIKLAEPSVKAPNEKACAWVSTNPFWEHTATKGKANDKGDYQHLTFQEHKNWLGCARIEVKAVGVNAWNKVKHLANMDLTFAKQMEVTGVNMGGNPLEWYGSLEPIKKENWIKIEVLKEGQWIEYNPKNDEAKTHGLTFVSIILPTPNEGEMALLLFTKNEMEQLVNSHNENSKNNLNPANGYYSMWQESDAYHDIDLNPYRLTGVLTQEQYDILVKPKYEELEAYRKQAQKQ